jgi:pimeloyl-ACP methyl ester carboxylesterase
MPALARLAFMKLQPNATAVLVHGAWADGSSWNSVILPLQRAGLNVIAAPIPLTSLSDDAAALKRALARTSGPVLLAGHAYAGAVIASVNSERVRGLVYIAALAPDEGETVAHVFYKEPPHAMAPKLSPDDAGLIWMPDDGFANAFAHRATADQIALARAVQRPISVKCIQEPSPKPLWKSKPAWFLIAEEDRMINPKTQQFMAQRMKAIFKSAAVDHTPMLTAPNEVVQFILAAAKTTLV